MYQLRRATKNDAPGIRDLIREAQINPLDLDWQRFVVAMAPEGELVGCGQIKTHRDGSRELASIAVTSIWRKQGIARAIIEYLVVQNPGTLYLTCRVSLGTFYQKFNFRPVEIDEMPAYFRRVIWLFRLLSKVGLVGEGLLVMKREW